MTTNTSNNTDIDSLLEAIRQQYAELQKAASLAPQAARLAPVEEAGMRIRDERKKQGLTLNELCDLSGVAYATLAKIEKGTENIRLDSLISVTDALGMKLWVG